MSDQEVPIAEGLFTWPSSQPHLLGGRCAACEAVTFPMQTGCPKCAATEMKGVELSSTGTVWTWTTQEFLPPTPPYTGPETKDNFVPYYVGYVELEGDLRVESRFIGFDDEPPHIGQSVETVLVPFRKDSEGSIVMTYAFAPTKESRHA